GQLIAGAGAEGPGAKPVLTAWIEELGLRPALVDDRGRPILRHTPRTLAASVDNSDPDKISFLRWQIDGGDWEEFSEALGTRRKVDLSGRLRWTRGEHRLRVALLPFEADARQSVHEQRVLYLPPAPEVVFARDWLVRTAPGKVLREADLVLEALVRPAEGEQAEVTIELNGKKALTRLIESPPQGDRPNVRVSLKLDERPGKGGKTPNQVVFIAKNKGAFPGHELREQVQRVFSLPHIPTPVPEVSVRAVTPS